LHKGALADMLRTRVFAIACGYPGAVAYSYTKGKFTPMQR